MTVLHSKILGDGPPLLILHGFLGMADNWKTLGNQYAQKGFQVHLVDQRNHGRSFWSADFDYEILADDLKAYVAHYRLQKVALIGHSMGGKTAMQFAVNQSESVRKLIVADIAPKFYPPHHQHIIDALNGLDLSKIPSRSKADEALAERLTDWGIRQFLLKNLYWIESGKLGFRFNLEVLKDKMEEIGENINGTASFSGQTLFLRGDRSEYILPNDYLEIKNHFPQAKVDSVANAGHWVHAENPRQFFEKSLAFLNP